MRLRPANQKDYSHVADWEEGGKRRRKFFPSFKAAQMWAAKKKAALGLIPRDAEPVTPEEFRAVLEAREAGVPLMDAVQHWKVTAGAHGGRTVADLIEARLAAAKKDEISDHYRVSLERVLEKAGETMGAMKAVSVTPQDCQAFIALWTGHASMKQARAMLGSVFTHAQRMGWLQFNPASSLRLTRRKGAVPVSLFSISDAAEWLSCIAARAPDCLAGWAIAMFAGLRAAEVQRLDWSEVRLERGFIEVTAAKAKTMARRLVDISGNLAVILDPLAQKTGRVFPLSPKRQEAWARQQYGRPLPKNAARHSFISYHLGLFGDVALTELQAGHDRKVMFQNYRELVTKEESESYFTITTEAGS